MSEAEKNETSEAKIDATNRFGVARAHEKIVLLRAFERERSDGPPVLSQSDALNLAAWLVALADPSGERFALVLQAVVRKA